MKYMNYFNRLLSIVIGLLFLVSGFSKIIDSNGFIKLLFQYGLGGFSYIGSLLSPIEVLLGLCLLINSYVKKTAFFVFFLTIIFTIFYFNAFYFKGINDCGCFGNWFITTPIISFTRNIIIIVGSYFVWQNTKVSQSTNAWQKVLLMLFGSLSFSLSGYTVDNSLVTSFSFKTIEGKKLSETSLINLTHITPAKKYACFVFSPSCPHCWNVTENIKKLKESGIYEDVIGIVNENSKSGLIDYKEKMKPNFKVFILKNSQISKSIGIRVPKLLIIKDDAIVKIFENDEIPCPQLIENFKVQ